MADSFKIIYESNQLSENSKSNLDYLNKLQLHFSYIFVNGKTFLSSTISDLKKIYLQSSLDDTITKQSSQKIVSSLYNHTLSSLTDMKEIIESIGDQLLTPIETHHHHLSNIYTENLDGIHNISTNILEAKQNLERAKSKYIESSKQSFILERKLKDIDEQNSNSSEEYNKHNDILIRARSQTETLAQFYKYEITKANQIYSVNNAKYSTLVEKIKAGEESRIQFTKDIISKYCRIISNYKLLQQTIEEQLMTLSSQINMDKDIKTISDMFDNVNIFGERFPKEEFIQHSKDDMDEIQLGSLIIDNSKHPNEEVNLFSEFEIVSESKVYSDNYQAEIIREYIVNIFKSDEVLPEQMSKITDLLNNNPFFAKSFLDQLISKEKVFNFHLLNYNNLIHLANILNSINLGVNYSEKEANGISYATIIIAEKTFYSNQDDYNDIIYLCAVLSQTNKLYSTKTFWRGIIMAKLVLKLEEHLTQLQKINIVKPKKEKTDFFETLGSGFKSVFSKDKQEAVHLLEIAGLSKSIANYNSLPDHKRPYLDNFAIKDLQDIIQEFIPYFGSFNYHIEDSIILIKELSIQFNLDKEKQKFFSLFLISCSQTAKKRTQRVTIERSMKLKTKIYDLKHHTKTQLVSKYPIARNIQFMSIKHKLLILTQSCVFLPLDDFGSLLRLNKAISIDAKKRLIKAFMSQNKVIDLNTRLKLWHILLNSRKIKAKLDYDKASLEAEKGLSAKLIDLIKIDSLRTSFPKDNDGHRIILKKILTTLAYTKPNIDYCQGMNYITAFVFQLYNYNEAETFYFMMGLFEEAGYEKLFEDDLEKLKTIFYVFDRLLGLYIPELWNYFKHTKINVNYFLPPWFITFFTNSAMQIDRNNPPNVILKIWDSFLVSGWKAFIMAGLAILKHFEGTLLTMKYDKLLSFIPSSIASSDFLTNNHYDEFASLFQKFHISKSLICNLENEYEIEKPFNPLDRKDSKNNKDND